MDLVNQPSLTYIDCNNCSLASLDISAATALPTLWCNNNNLTSLDVSNNPALDVSNNPALTGLYCNDNDLTSLDINGNSLLTTLWCQNNYIVDTSALTAWLEVEGHSGTITPQWLIDVSSTTIDSINEQTYTGSAITPEPTLTFGDLTLVKDRDYTLSYDSNTNVGTATITITGIGACTGTTTVDFDIISVPGTPLSLVATAGNTLVELSWEAPDSDNGSAITGYNIYRDGNKVNADLLATTTFTDSDLTNGTTYSYAISAVNGVGEGALCEVQSAKPNRELSAQQFAGTNRFDTMSKIVNEVYAAPVSTVIIATAYNYHDALAASGLAGLNGAPILITDGTSLSSETAVLIDTLEAANAIIVGGNEAISSAVADALLAKGLSVKRVYGPDRISTSLAIYAEGQGWSNTAIIVNGFGFADALSISPYAYANRSPIFLTGGGESNLTLSQATIDAISSGGFTRILLVGGPAVISDEVKTQLGDSFTYVPLAGDNRYQTSARIAEFAVGDGVLSYNDMAISTGRDFPDAMVGSALCGVKRSVMLLADDSSDAARYCIDNTIQSNAPAINNTYFLGGDSVVPPALRQRVERACEL